MCEMCVQGCELVVNQALLSKTTISDVKGTDADSTATFFSLLHSSVDKSVAIYDTVSDGGVFLFCFAALQPLTCGQGVFLITATQPP